VIDWKFYAEVFLTVSELSELKLFPENYCLD